MLVSAEAARPLAAYAANRLVSDGTHSFIYDNTGRMTSDGVNSFTWDRANHLLSMGSAAYLYNGLGQRVQQTVSAQVTQYLLDVQPGLWQVLAATTGTNTTRYVHGPMGLLEQQNPDTTWRWPVMDGLGSVRGVVDSTLTPAESRLYSPYGEGYGGTGSSQTVFGYTGEPTDTNGLVQLRARYYNPTLGVFPSLDPFEGGMSQPMTLNRYGYTGENPVNRRDPTGLFIFDYNNTMLMGGGDLRGGVEGIIEEDDWIYCIGRQGGVPDNQLEEFTKLVIQLNGADNAAFRHYQDNPYCGRQDQYPCLAPRYILKVPDSIPGTSISGINATGQMRNATGWRCGKPPAPPKAPPPPAATPSIPSTCTPTPEPGPKVLTGGFRVADVTFTVGVGYANIGVEGYAEWRCAPYKGQCGWFFSFSIACGGHGGKRIAKITPGASISAGEELGLEIWPSRVGEITYYNDVGASVPQWVLANAQADFTWDPNSGSFVIQAGVSIPPGPPSAFLASGASVYLGPNLEQVPESGLEGIRQALRYLIGFCVRA